MLNKNGQRMEMDDLTQLQSRKEEQLIFFVYSDDEERFGSGHIINDYGKYHT